MTLPAAILTLLRLPGAGPSGVNLILERLFQMGVPPERLRELSDRQLEADLRLSPAQVAALRRPASDPETDLAHCAMDGFRVLLPRDSEYPLRALQRLGRAAPPLLFAQGNLDLLNCPALGVSGSRRSAPASLAAASDLAREAASQGWVVVSGGARGADEAAHLGAMAGAGTVVVLPTGLFQPKLRRETLRHLESGKTLMLSEFPPEFGWTAGCAMQRNRLLAALSQVMVLVEPGRQGGTGGTGRLARKLGLPLFILHSPAGLGDGAEEFLRDGAHLLSLRDHDPASLAALLRESAATAQAAREAGRTLTLFPS